MLGDTLAETRTSSRPLIFAASLYNSIAKGFLSYLVDSDSSNYTLVILSIPKIFFIDK